MQPSVLPGVNFRKDRRANFDCVRDIVVLGWPQFAAALNPVDLIAAPCRLCVQIAKIPICPDALRGWPPPVRERRNPAYSHPLVRRVDTPASSADIPLQCRTGATDGRPLMRPGCGEVTFHPHPTSWRDSVTDDIIQPPPPPADKYERVTGGKTSNNTTDSSGTTIGTDVGSALERIEVRTQLHPSPSELPWEPTVTESAVCNQSLGVGEAISIPTRAPKWHRLGVDPQSVAYR